MLNPLLSVLLFSAFFSVPDTQLYTGVCLTIEVHSGLPGYHFYQVVECAWSCGSEACCGAIRSARPCQRTPHCAWTMACTRFVLAAGAVLYLHVMPDELAALSAKSNVSGQLRHLAASEVPSFSQYLHVHGCRCSTPSQSNL